MTANSGYRRDIDGLRALAVLPVVFAHAGLPGFSGGYVGVDVFFIISGYLITGILLREIRQGRFSLADFYERRARRILPALFAVLAACTALSWFILPPDLLEGYARSVLATVLFVSNFWFWRSSGDYFGQAAEWEPLLHTWSLAVEEQFYVFFPLLLCLLAGKRMGTVIAAVAVLSLCSLAASAWFTSAQPQAAYFLTFTRIWELGLGALLAAGALPGSRQRALVELVAAAGLVAILYSVVAYDAATPFPGVAALLPCGGAVALIWAGAQGRPAATRLLSSPVFVGIGLVSYSLYLWHWPVLVYTRLLQGSAELALVPALAAIGIALLLAWFSWRWVEQPFRHRGGFWDSRTALVRGGSAFALLLVVVAVVINAGKGFPERLPADVLKVYTEAVERTPVQERCMGRLPEQGLCRFGDGPAAGPADVLIWGDSHAGAFLPGFELWTSARGLTGLSAVKSACPPLLGVVRADKGESHRCDEFNRRVMEFLERRQDLGTVILVARWAQAVEGTPAPGEGGADAVLVPAGSSRPLPAGYGNAELVEQALADTVARVRATGREVLIVKGVPEVGFSVPVAVVNAQFVGTRLEAAPTRTEVEKRNRRADLIIETVATELDARHASLVPELCDPDCKVQEDGVPLYRDDDHLSTYGARRLVPELLNLALGEGPGRG
ncbi:acyltransferase family protein [Microbulbifer yueqingensis]|uniref:Peptidoglycan/LPS O-acetylase OafA/YrhL, contains acyltransferase and SGNH-hydrolase domains n=1 Tax=Microbulbifer yueqingensis TaxID=658219 RepID=A0A1G8X365_9GAMM|nr:acyltransferase family protein [Microbulbifer yueqingensis]SDJ84884.1 Peptidoglycan/LPS O-acetylase OafA/YrhL, contains acyltransferase and SGNH-hydrolase domains [Microbulbifer yueqingensis]